MRGIQVSGRRRREILQSALERAEVTLGCEKEQGAADFEESVRDFLKSAVFGLVKLTREFACKFNNKRYNKEKRRKEHAKY